MLDAVTGERALLGQETRALAGNARPIAWFLGAKLAAYDGHVRRPDRGGRVKAILKIDGMLCGACALDVDDALEDLDGVRRSKTSYVRARAKVDYDEARVTAEDLQRAITDLGYELRRA